MPKKKEPTFEESMDKLEAIVNNIEDGDLPLTELMKQYSEGVELAKKCMQALDTAEKTIDILVGEEDGKVFEKPLEIG